MEYYKVEKNLGNLVNDNVKKLESIFPSVVKDGEIDLEELKELRSMTAGHLYAVAFNRGYLKAKKEVREKAIDDFVKEFNRKTSMENKLIDEIAEKLKGGVDNA